MDVGIQSLRRRTRKARRFALGLAINLMVLAAGLGLYADDQPATSPRVLITDEEVVGSADPQSKSPVVQQTSLLQPQPLTPRISPELDLPAPAPATEFAGNLLG